MEEESVALQRRSKRRATLDVAFHGLVLMATAFALIALAVLMFDVFRKGLGWLDFQFLVSFPSRIPERAGIYSSLTGTLWVTAITALFAFPIGVATAIFLEEYAPKNRLMNFIDINIANLAGVPSIVYGILGLAIFVRGMMLGRTVLAGALTMTLLVLPIMIITSREAIRSVPSSLRLAFLAMGATQWQTIRHIVLPASLSGIFTGSILTVSRAIGETAPLILIGALSFVAFVPRSPLDEFTVLPIQIFSWVSRPQAEFSNLAAAAIIVLLIVLLSMNAVSVWLRLRFEKRNSK